MVAAEAGEAIQPVSLEQAVQIALAENLGLITESYTRLAAREDVVIADSEFEPFFTASARSAVNQQPSASSDLDGADRPRSEGANATAGIGTKVVTGAVVQLDTILARNESNSAFSESLLYDADVAVSIRQPLLRGGGVGANRARRERARIGADRSDLTFQAAAFDVIRDTEINFYDLAFALGNLDVQQRGLDAAIQFREENEARLDAGLATELDVMQARVAEANRQSLILRARQQVRDAADRLLVILGRHEFAGLPEPVDIEFGEEVSLSVARSYGLALERDPDIQNVHALIRQLELDVVLASNDKRPQLDLGGALGYKGRNSENIGEAIHGARQGDGYNWRVDLTLNVPWGLNEGRARERQANLGLEQQRARLRQLEQDLLVRVRAAVRAVETDLQTVDTSVIAAELSSRETELERAKFDAGLSTSRLVVEAQQREDEARIRETEARILLKQNRARLRRIEGSALSHFGIEIPET